MGEKKRGSNLTLDPRFAFKRIYPCSSLEKLRAIIFDIGLFLDRLHQFGSYL
jgi:hypothetical protein